MLNNSVRMHYSNKLSTRRESSISITKEPCNLRKHTVLVKLKDTRTQPLDTRKVLRIKKPRLQLLKPRKTRLSARELLLPIKRSKSSKRKQTLWLSLPLKRWPLLRAAAP